MTNFGENLKSFGNTLRHRPFGQSEWTKFDDRQMATRKIANPYIFRGAVSRCVEFASGIATALGVVDVVNEGLNIRNGVAVAVGSIATALSHTAAEFNTNTASQIVADQLVHEVEQNTRINAEIRADRRIS